VSSDEIYQQLSSIMRDVFDDDSLVATPSSPRGRLTLDSFSHLRLMLSIERSFGVDFAASEISSLKNVGELAALIGSKLPAERAVHLAKNRERPVARVSRLVAVVALLLAISRSHGWRSALLLVANVGFVLTFSHDLRQLAPFARSWRGFVAMRLMHSQKNPAVFATAIGALVLLFCWLKRYTFFPPGALLPFVYLTVGMSYVFFRVLSLVVDAYQDSLPSASASCVSSTIR